MDNDTNGSSNALAEGRRIYLGNLLYTVKAEEVEDGLRDHGFDDFETVHMSVDAVSLRNPGYCFVDFASRDGAERALESLNATIAGRTLKVGPCKPKQPRANSNNYNSNHNSNNNNNNNNNSSSNRWNSHEGRSGSQRWGNGSGAGAHPHPHQRVAPERYDDAVEEGNIRRVYVGGLAQQDDPDRNVEELTEIFADFKPTAFSKRITPHESTKSFPGNHHYCFVDFATSEEAQAAIDALNGKVVDDGAIKVSLARPPPNKARERSFQHNDRSGGGRVRRNPREHEVPPGEGSPAGSRSMASDNWRRRND
ncbi:uncharacterized protein UV8b_07001 [Ustilaginoidea virens]|uniref:RRM domain-containing protein n=1 Tax=Ustilaginoidea virens TaxID=1159556 RepID=A0A063CBQ1_USTVR|nr:uncharacterized protein UV8b_07001 [Ustilaginoidea virens]QUC22760.1 hypothetical protein UV8b_07001 [Ustilaginoidea virens]GAO16510.1 hypothetical protein UVI_02010830 [Ustilaginoidea virens]